MAQKVNIGTPPYPPSGGGGTPSTGGSGGGNPAAAKSVNIPTSNGGVMAQKQIALYPCFSLANNRTEYHAFDPTLGFNDPYAHSEYHWKVEQIKPYRNATTRSVLVCYRDLGRVALTFTVTGCDDHGNIIATSTPLGWGSATPTNRLFMVKVDLVFTGQLPQLSVRREANAGSLSIVQAVLTGEVEDNVTL